MINRIEYDAIVSTSLSKEIKLEVDGYIQQELDYDDEGFARTAITEHVSSDLLEEFKDQDYSVLELLEILKDIALSKKNSTLNNSFECTYWNRIYNACKGWTEDELSII